MRLLRFDSKVLKYNAKVPNHLHQNSGVKARVKSLLSTVILMFTCWLLLYINMLSNFYIKTRVVLPQDTPWLFTAATGDLSQSACFSFFSTLFCQKISLHHSSQWNHSCVHSSSPFSWTLLPTFQTLPLRCLSLAFKSKPVKRWATPLPLASLPTAHLSPCKRLQPSLLIMQCLPLISLNPLWTRRASKVIESAWGVANPRYITFNLIFLLCFLYTFFLIISLPLFSPF